MVYSHARLSTLPYLHDLCRLPEPYRPSTVTFAYNPQTSTRAVQAEHNLNRTEIGPVLQQPEALLKPAEAVGTQRANWAHKTLLVVRAVGIEPTRTVRFTGF